MLADEEDAIVVVEDDDADRQVREVDDAVDAVAAVGPVDLVVPDGDPGVRVGLAPRPATPRADGDGRSSGGLVRWRVVIEPIVARPGRQDPSGCARTPILGRMDEPTERRARPTGEPAGPRGRGPVRRPDPGLRRPRAVGEPVAARAAGRRDGRRGRFRRSSRCSPTARTTGTRRATSRRGEWLAARGFAFCRLDVRGTGSSPGIALDEYTARETQDGYDAVEWLAAQAWSNGRVAMWGISYGGFTAIQVALLHPPHLAAIVPMMATRRPLHRRRPLPRRLHDGVRAEPVRGQHGRDERAPGGAGLPRRGVDRRVARPARADAGLAVRMAAPAARRAVLAAGLRRAGLGPPDDADAPHRRLDGRVRRRRAPDARALHERAAPGADRQLGPRLPGRRLSRPEPRLEPRAGAVPRSLAEGDRQRGHGRAGPRRVPPRLGAAGAVPGGLAGRVDRRAGVAAGGSDRDGLPARERGPTAARPAGRGGSGGRTATRPAAHAARAPGWRPSAIGRRSGRARASRGARATRRTASPATSAPTTPAVPDLHVGAARGGPRRPRRRRRRADVGVARCRSRPRSSASRTSPRTARPFQVASRDPEPDPSRLPRDAGGRSSRASPTDVRVVLRSTAHRFRAGHRIRLSVASAMWPVVWPSPEPAEHRLHLGGTATRRLVLPTVPAGRPGDPGAAVQDDAGRAPRDRRASARIRRSGRSSRT